MPENVENTPKKVHFGPINTIKYTLKAIQTSSDYIHNKWANLNPDIYTQSDAEYFYKKTKNKKYVLGDEKLDISSPLEFGKLWSMPWDIQFTLRKMVKDAHHTHMLPFVMGTYQMRSISMSMNDFCLTDPYMVFRMATGGLEGFSAPILRGIYFAGRRSWWRHETIHARHHTQMAYLLNAKENKNFQEDIGWANKEKIDEAMYTVHEAGIEELLTRWQALKEARGFREKAMSSLAMLFYMEYAPFTGVRNLFIDAKEASLDLIDNGKLRIPAKFATLAGIVYLPFWLDSQNGWVANLSKNVADSIPGLVDIPKIEGLIYRGLSYIDVAAFSSMFSSKEKGVLDHKKEITKRIPTSEYKFPYVYNPIKATINSIDFLNYINKTWDHIPNYRKIESVKGLDGIKTEVEDRVVKKLNPQQTKFTMAVLEDALKPFEQFKRSDFPNDVYVKGMFVPSLYIRLSEMYDKNSIFK